MGVTRLNLVPIAEERWMGYLVFWGIISDSIRGELRLPLDKLMRLRDQVKK